MANVYRVLALLLVVGLSVGGLTVWRPREKPADPRTAPTLEPFYANPVEKTETHILASGEALSNLLARAALTSEEMSAVLLGLREHVNPRYLTAGDEVTVRRWTHDNSPRTIEIRVNADTTVRLMREGFGWASSLQLTPVKVDTVYAAGMIDAGRTLYEAMVYDEESNLRPEERVKLVYALAEIYEYKLDFTREIQPGDSYRLVYEREARPDGTARDRRILVAEIVNQGHLFSSVWFHPNDEVRGYYDKEGRPLRSGFSKYPVDFPRITSNFSSNRYHPILGVNRAHLGTDFGARTGTPVKSTADGTVTFAGRSGGYGNMIRIRHMNGYETRYAHLSRFAKGVRTGAKVTQKQLIGHVGATGLATAPHLHYELRQNGRAINLRTARLPDAPPLGKKYLGGFKDLSDVRLSLLEDATRRYAAAKASAEAKKGGADGG
ncbi:MAG: M23 family metallopeptidase [Longimicrobiales bacterium]